MDGCFARFLFKQHETIRFSTDAQANGAHRAMDNVRAFQMAPTAGHLLCAWTNGATDYKLLRVFTDHLMATCDLQALFLYMGQRTTYSARTCASEI